MLPFRPAESSNGEFLPRPPTARDRLIAATTLARVADAADRLSIDRRQLLQSAGGMAALLGAINLTACSGGGDRASPATTTTTSTPGGTFEVPTTIEDEVACAAALAGTEFIFDVHTHHVVPDGPWRESAPRIAQMIRDLVPPDCMEADPYDCLNRASYIEDMFLGSDTTIALLSDVPNSGPADAPMPFAEAMHTQDLAASLTIAGEPRVLIHNVIAPNFGPLQARLDDMSTQVDTGR
ncbi:MAG: hypothetical protein QOH68_1990, partial [Nocardioidaceae bacterium]|nr:hypothetical protein [Nocardioidaceae bacterium]